MTSAAAVESDPRNKYDSLRRQPLKTASAQKQEALGKTPAAFSRAALDLERRRRCHRRRISLWRRLVRGRG